jgi:hypothetical protein
MAMTFFSGLSIEQNLATSVQPRLKRIETFYATRESSLMENTSHPQQEELCDYRSDNLST